MDIHIYLSACISTEVSWSVSQLVGTRYIIYLTSYSLTIASTFGSFTLSSTTAWCYMFYEDQHPLIFHLIYDLAFNWFFSSIISSLSLGSLTLLSMNCIVALLSSNNQTSWLLDQYQPTTLCDNNTMMMMMIHSLFKFW